MSLHPIFAEILQSFASQPALLERAARKAAPRRFSSEPPSGLMPLDEPDLRSPEERAADQAYHFQEMCDADRRMEDKS